MLPPARFRDGVAGGAGAGNAGIVGVKDWRLAEVLGDRAPLGDDEDVVSEV